MDEETKKIADEIYDIGFKNGGISMKNKILKRINHDWSLVTIKSSAGLVIKIMKIINKIK